MGRLDPSIWLKDFAGGAEGSIWGRLDPGISLEGFAGVQRVHLWVVWTMALHNRLLLFLMRLVLVLCRIQRD